MGAVADKIVFPLANEDYVLGCEPNEEREIQWLTPGSWTKKNCEHDIPYIKITCEKPRYAILYSHGNAENIYTVRPFLEDMAERLKADVWCWDYAGYGPHKGRDKSRPTEENVYNDVNRVMDEMQHRYQDKVPIVVWGRSLGTAPSIRTTVEHQKSVHRLIVESGFRSCVRVVQPTWVAASIHSIFDMFDNEAELVKLEEVPTMFIHGKKDCIIPIEHGEHLYKICKASKEFVEVPDGTHNNIDSGYREELFIHVDRFLH